MFSERPNLFRVIALLFWLSTLRSTASAENVEEDCPSVLNFGGCTCSTVATSRYLLDCRGLQWKELKFILSTYSHADLDLDLSLVLRDYQGNFSDWRESLGIDTLDVLKNHLHSLSLWRMPTVQQSPDFSWASGMVELILSGMSALSNHALTSSILPPHLQRLRLSSTRLTKIDHEMLNGLYNLTTLELEGHASIELIGQPFQDLRNLTALSIIGGLSSFSDNASLGLENLKFLNLSHNELPSVPKDVFTDMLQLEVLDLSHNEIQSLPANLLGNKPNLHYISLAYNNLEEIPAQLFHSSRNLTEIDLSHNNMASLSFGLLDYSNRLVVIDLSHNSLVVFPTDVLHAQNSLVNLYLSGNLIETLDGDLLQGLSSLQSLDLSSNLVTSIPAPLFSHAGNLTLLNVSNNRIQVVRKVVLEALNGTRVDFSGNALTCTCNNLALAEYLTIPGNYPTGDIHCVDPRSFKIYSLLKLNSTNCMQPTTVRIFSTALEALFFVGTILFLLSLIIAIGSSCAYSRQSSRRQSFYPGMEIPSGPHAYGVPVETKTHKVDLTTVL